MRRFFWVLGLIFGVSAGYAMEVKDVPNPRVERGSYVQDSAGLLGGSESAQLDALAVELEAKTGAELAIVTIDNLGGQSVEEFANLLFKRYGVGKKDKNNGILILVAHEDRRFRVEVGYGLEAVLPDALCKRLMDQRAVPHFKAGRFGNGLYDLGLALAQKVADNHGVALSLSENFQNEAPTENSQALGLMGSAPEEISPGPEWWRFANGAAFFGFTLLFVAYRTVRLHLSPSLAGRRLALGRDGTAYPAKLILVVFFSTFALGFFTNAGLSILSAVVGTGLALGLWVAWRKFYQPRVEGYRRRCSRCRQAMNRIEESADDRLLKEHEIDEEIAEGMDYEFWRCPGCAFDERFNVELPYASDCPACRNRSLVTKETITLQPTYSANGQKRIDKNCKYRACRHAETIFKSIPKKVKSSSSSSGGGGGGGGSFGGGSSGGGGASGGW